MSGPSFSVTVLSAFLLIHGLVAVSNIVNKGFGAAATQFSIVAWILGVGLLSWVIIRGGD